MMSIIFIALGSMVIGGVVGFSAAAVCIVSKTKDCSECPFAKYTPNQIREAFGFEPITDYRITNEDAEVSGNAQVYDEAEVYGNAEECDKNEH